MQGASKPASAGGGNSYEFNARGVLQLYGGFIEGTPNCTLAVLSKGPLSAEARAAFQASAERLGFGKDACAWVVLECDAGELGASDVLSVIEGLGSRRGRGRRLACRIVRVGRLLPRRSS